MESKKIVDYKIISGSTDGLNPYNPNEVYKAFNDNQRSVANNSLKVQDIKQQLNKYHTEISSIEVLLKREVGKKYPPFSILEKVDYAFLKFETDVKMMFDMGELEFTDSIRNGLIERKKWIEKYRITGLNEKLTETINNLEKCKLEVENTFKLIQKSFIERESIELERIVLFYISQGYVPLGGVNEKAGTGFQAMVKYEE